MTERAEHWVTMETDTEETPTIRYQCRTIAKNQRNVKVRIDNVGQIGNRVQFEHFQHNSIATSHILAYRVFNFEVPNTRNTSRFSSELELAWAFSQAF